MKQEEVEVVVALGQEISQDTGGVATADLIGRQAEVDTLDEVPQLSHGVLAETPGKGVMGQRLRFRLGQGELVTSTIRHVPLSDPRQDEEHPEVDAKHQDDLEDDLPHHCLPQVQGPVHHHGAKLDQHHHKERFWNLVFRQGRSDVGCC